MLYRYYEKLSNSKYADIYIDSIQQLNVYYQLNQNYSKSVYCNVMMGCYYSYTKEFDKAFKVFKIAEQDLDYNKKLSPTVYYHLSSILESTDKYNSDRYLDKAYHASIKYSDTLYLGMTYFKYSLSLPLDSSIKYVKKSLNLLGRLENQTYYGGVRFMWIDHFYGNEPDSVLKYGVPYYNEYHDLDCVESIALAYVRKEQYDSATYFMSLMENNGRLRVPYFISLSEMFAKQGNFENAYYAMVSARDAMKFKMDSTLASSCKLNNSEAELYTQVERHKENLMIIYYILFILILLLVSLIIFSIIFYRRKKKNVLNSMDSTLSKQVDNFTDHIVRSLIDSYRGNKDYQSMKAVVVGLLYDKNEKQWSKTEVFILWLMAMDLSNDEIARILDISMNYLYQIKSKFNNIGINSAEDALLFCSEIISHKCK